MRQPHRHQRPWEEERGREAAETLKAVSPAVWGDAQRNVRIHASPGPTGDTWACCASGEDRKRSHQSFPASTHLWACGAERRRGFQGARSNPKWSRLGARGQQVFRVSVNRCRTELGPEPRGFSSPWGGRPASCWSWLNSCLPLTSLCWEQECRDSPAEESSWGLFILRMWAMAKCHGQHGEL